MKYAFLILALAPVTLVRAAPMCVSAPLSTYLAAGFNCEIDTALLRSFDFQLQNDTSPTVPLTPDQITVSPLSAPGQVGLRFAGDFGALGAPNGPGLSEGQRNNSYRFFYEVSRPDSLFIAIGSVLNDPSVFSPDPFKATATYAINYASNDGASSLAKVDPTTTTNLTDTVPLNLVRPNVLHDFTVSLTGGASAQGTAAPVGFVSLSSADSLASYIVPEPAAWTLCLLGAPLVVLLRRALST